ncbi:hypothetical protein S40288_08387 [Stachybotrys chartarum IBT 40288]|nr:hypothetical protein S40288_08387 [Stachybotrys chartarum IBT 40288]
MSTYLRRRTLSQYNADVVFMGKSAEEKRTFQFFCQCPTLKIAGVSKSDFWDHLLIQASTAERSIFHAVVAVSCAYRRHIMRSGNSGLAGRTALQVSSMIQDECLTFQQYNKAIRHLSRLIDQKDIVSCRLTAITCILFVCLEMLQGQLQSMDMHYRFGLSRLADMQKTQKAPIDEPLAQAYSRLTMHFDLIGQDSRCPNKTNSRNIVNVEIPPQFNTVKSARLILDELLIDIIALRKEAEQLDFDRSPPTSSIVHRQAMLRRHLLAWGNASKLSMKTTFAQISINEQLEVRILRAYHTMGGIILETSLSPKREIAFNAFTSEFASIISQSEDVLRLAGCLDPQPLQPQICGLDPAFSIECGGLPLMYYTSLKCRSPQLRRKAISLLSRTKHTEGLWTGPVLSQIATEIMQLEEEECDLKVLEQTTERTEKADERFDKIDTLLYLERIVPNHRRFYHIQVDLPVADAENIVVLTCTRPKQGGLLGCETVYRRMHLREGVAIPAP